MLLSDASLRACLWYYHPDALIWFCALASHSITVQRHTQDVPPATAGLYR